MSSDFIQIKGLHEEEQQWIEVAVTAAQEAGKILYQHFGQVQKISYKGAKDLVTTMDLQAQQLILSHLTNHFPDYAVLSEEGINTDHTNVPRWVIDPLDGTTNYAHGFPFFAVSIGLEQQGEGLLGVVYAPVLDELFIAVRGKGAYLNGRKIAVSTTKTLQDSLLATGFTGPYLYPGSPVFHDFVTFSIQAQGVRRSGSAAIDLCYIAAGCLDGFWEKGLHPWDITAAGLIIQEAGGRVSDFQGKPFHPMQRETVASNGIIHAEMLQILTNSAKDTSA